MTNITRVNGAPGAGKTHTLLDVIEREIGENNVGYDDILYLNFTNAGKEDSKEELLDRFENINEETIKDLVGTFHSAALNSVKGAGYYNNNSDDIIQPSSDKEIYRAFAHSQGMNYGGGTLYDLETEGDISGSGDTFFVINDWLASTYRKPKEARKAPTRFPWPSVDTFEQILAEWRDFKRDYDPEKRLWEHHEYVKKAIDNNVYPVSKVLLIDEFQDLSPLEYKYYKEWRDNGNVERVYIAGDPNQSIYSFRGADPYYFNQTDYDEEVVLDETYRCRGNIATIARKILEDSAHNDGREFTSRFEGGTVDYISGSSSTLMAAIEAATATTSDSLLLLTRTNRQWRSIAKFLRENGFPYSVLGTRGWSMWDDKSNLNILLALRLMEKADRIDPWAALELLKAAPHAEERKQAAESDKDGDFITSTLWDAFPEAQTTTQIVDKLDLRTSQASAIKNALSREEYNDPDQIRVGTIHTSKGLEADTAIVFPAYSNSMLDNYNKDLDTNAEEHRVAYVAATRARKRLQIFTNYFDYKHTMPVFTAPNVREVAA